MRPPSVEDFESSLERGLGWAAEKSYWIGMTAQVRAPGGLEPLPCFQWQPPEPQATQKTVLYSTHQRAGARMAPFDGWELPERIGTRREEHAAVRSGAGLFDTSHIGILEFRGDGVHLFLNTLTTNDISLLDNGQGQYSFLLDPDGHVLDDVYVFRLDADRYWLVVNAANADKDLAWVQAAREGRVQIDRERPWARALGAEAVSVRDIRQERVILALEGPRSREILLALCDSDDTQEDRHARFREQLFEMKRNQFIHSRLLGHDLYLARTGHTGEPLAFEIFVHPAAAAALWHTLLEEGRTLGLRPAGSRARESLRIEAGLPRYGCELAGPHSLNPAEAGFGPYVKLYKPFFVGKAAYLAHERRREARLVRFRFDEESTQLPGGGDVVVSRTGEVVGVVTSCSYDSDGCMLGLAHVLNAHSQVGAKLGLFQTGTKTWSDKPLADLKMGDRLQLHDDIHVIQRFLDKTD